MTDVGRYPPYRYHNRRLFKRQHVRGKQHCTVVVCVEWYQGWITKTTLQAWNCHIRSVTVVICGQRMNISWAWVRPQYKLIWFSSHWVTNWCVVCAQDYIYNFFFFWRGKRGGDILHCTLFCSLLLSYIFHTSFDCQRQEGNDWSDFTFINSTRFPVLTSMMCKRAHIAMPFLHLNPTQAHKHRHQP